jgi:hypothetical protein
MIEGRSNPHRTRGLVEVGTGLALVLFGIVASFVNYEVAVAQSGTTYTLMYGPIVAGLIALVRGVDDIFHVEGFGRRKRSEREVRTLQLVVGTVLTVFAVVVALTMFGASSWGTGMMGAVGLALTIGIVLLALGVTGLVPPLHPLFSLGMVVGGLGLIALVAFLYDPSVPLTAYRFLGSHARLVVGLCLVSEGTLRWLASRPDKVLKTTAKPLLSHDQRRHRMIIELGAGAVLILVGIGLTIFSYRGQAIPGTGYIVMYGPIVSGVLIVLRALMGDFKSFVAWRYLLVFESKVTKRTRVAAVIGLIIIV